MNTRPGPLAGRTIVVTRPQAQAAGLGAGIAGLGGVPLFFPLLRITSLDDLSSLQGVAAELAQYSLLIFISPNAVSHALPTLLAGRAWPSTATPVAVGPGTVRALAEAGVAPCLAPTGQYDSEALLALPALQADAVRGRRVAILRGDGGRELLADTLRARGALLDCIATYRRLPPEQGFATLETAWQTQQLDALTLSSSEGLRYLLAGLSAEGLRHLQQTPVFVPHQRIADSARSSGLQHVVLTKPADAGILEALCAYNWSQS